MIVNNAMPTLLTSHTSPMGRTSQVRSELGFSQTNQTLDSQQNQPTSFLAAVAGFHWNLNALQNEPSQVEGFVPQANAKPQINEESIVLSAPDSESPALAPIQPQPEFTQKITSEPTAPSSSNNTMQMADNETVLADMATTLMTTASLHALMKQTNQPPARQNVANPLTDVSVTVAGSSQKENAHRQASQMLMASLQQSASRPSANLTHATSALKVSAPDLQPILGQPGQGDPVTTQSQTPVMHHTNPTSSLNASQVQSAEWAAVRVDTSVSKWGEQMLQVLHDRVTLQAQQNLQEAKIRLDPPDLGKLDLLVRVEGDRLSVQINANTVATREALMQVSERLRTELQEQNFVHVDVNVGSHSGQQKHAHENPQEDATIFAARESNSPLTQTTTHNSEHWLNTQA